MSSHHRYAVLIIDGKPCQITGYYPWHPDRRRIEQFIADRFLAAHGAHIHHFMPLLLALETESGEVLAVVGMRDAKAETLFLEQYLDEPVEQVIHQHLQVECKRQHVLEVGNLAAIKPGYGRYLFAVLTELFSAWDYRWLACTGIAGVVNLLRRLGIQSMTVAQAIPERIPGAAEEWGRYYQKQPQVMVGEIAQGRAVVERCGLLQACQFQRLEQSHVRSA